MSYSPPGFALKRQIIVRMPASFRSALKFREKLEAVAKLNGVPVKFVGVVGGIMIEGEAGHIERFIACYDAAHEEQRE